MNDDIYPFCTSVGGGKIETSTKRTAAVEEYYKSYGRGTFIWHKSWEDAYEYCMKENKRQTEYLKTSLNHYKQEAKKLKAEKQFRKALKGII